MCSKPAITILFSFFIFSMPAKVVIKVLEFKLLGIDMVWAPSLGHFTLAYRAKLPLSRTLNVFMSANINSVVLFPNIFLNYIHTLLDSGFVAIRVKW